MQNDLVQGDFNAHFDIKNAQPCLAVFYKLEVTITRQVMFKPKSNLENFGPFFGLDRLRNVQNAY